MSKRDTIAAIATPHGHGGVGIVRLSGPEAGSIAEAITGRPLRARRAHLRRWRDVPNGSGESEVIDSGLVLFFPAPNSYTGEDVVEFQGHGNPLVLDRLLRRLYSLGVRPARPGEFSERAFLEGRLDLAQAEAVADLVVAGSEAAARAAQRSLDGAFSRRVDALLQTLIEARLHVEAAIDFPEEEIDFLADGAIRHRLDTLIGAHAALLAAARQGQLLRDGRVVAIVGRPNAGKSSLLNALAGVERAIVTAVPGTTRDVLREVVRLGPVALTLIDTAGLRDTADVVEAEGVRRARTELARADHAVLVIDDSAVQDVAALRRECPPQLPRTLVFNKIDLSGRAPALETGSADDGVAESRIAISATTGAGLPLLREHLAALAGQGAAFEGSFSARTRHVEALERTGASLSTARDRLDSGEGELVAEELRRAQQALSEITGAYTPDDLLGAIFGSFCIGK